MSWICKIAPVFVQNREFSGFVLDDGNCKIQRVNECLLGTHSCDSNAECLGKITKSLSSSSLKIKTRKTASTVNAFQVFLATVLFATIWTSAHFEKEMTTTARIFLKTQLVSTLLAALNAAAFPALCWKTKNAWTSMNAARVKFVRAILIV